MKTILLIALIAILTPGLTTATVSFEKYDIDNNGIVDVIERQNLDIDIENSRLTPAESRVINDYTSAGTIILNDEFQSAFLNANKPVTIVESVEIVEDTPESIPIVTPSPVTNVTVPVSEDVGDNTTLMFIVGMLVLAGIIMFVFSKQNKQY